jgi:hypothetical protein
MFNFLYAYFLLFSSYTKSLHVWLPDFFHKILHLITFKYYNIYVTVNYGLVT